MNTQHSTHEYGLMRTLMLIITMVCLFSCGETDKERINHLVKEWNGKQIVFPDVMQFTLLGNDTNYLPRSEYKILSYVDSIGCTSCKLKLSQWKEFINQLDSTGNCSVLFFLHPKNQKEMGYILKRDHFAYPVCMDVNDSMNKLNHFPPDIMFQTFLLDKDNKIIAIGNPVHNPKVKELYMNIIQGKTSIKEENSILTKIQVKENTISLGRFNWQEEQKVQFMIYNVGNRPLVINDVSTSCGCTSVDYSKQPVSPGDSVSLQVAYKAEHPEHFGKTITVYCNTSPSLIQLKITGDAE